VANPVKDFFDNKDFNESLWTTDLGANGAVDEQVSDGELVMTCGVGTNADPSRIYQASISGDFDIVIKVSALDHTADSQQQWAGIFMWNASNYYFLAGYYWSNIKYADAFAWRQGGSSGSGTGTGPEPATCPFWIRLVRSGSTVTAYGSTDYEPENTPTWTEIESHDITSNDCQVGIFANDNAGGGGWDVSIDYFVNNGDYPPTCTGWTSPGTVVNFNAGGVAWEDPDNVKVSDDNHAYVQLINAEQCQYLVAYNFGFAIPAGATIDGVEVRIEKNGDETEFLTPGYVFLTRSASGNPVTDDSPDEETITEWEETDFYEAFGGEEALWGFVDLDEADVEDSDFGVYISGLTADIDATAEARVDHIQVNVYYTEATTTTTSTSLTTLSTTSSSSTSLTTVSTTLTTTSTSLTTLSTTSSSSTSLTTVSTTSSSSTSLTTVSTTLTTTSTTCAPFHYNSPKQEDNLFDDIDKVRENFYALRVREACGSAPSNPQAGMLWFDTTNQQLKQRNVDNDAWLILWDISTDEVPTKKIEDHIAENITAANTVHGIRQGSGNSLDLDKLDGYHASEFLTPAYMASSHTAKTRYNSAPGMNNIIQWRTGSWGYTYTDVTYSEYVDGGP